MSDRINRVPILLVLLLILGMCSSTEPAIQEIINSNQNSPSSEENESTPSVEIEMPAAEALDPNEQIENREYSSVNITSAIQIVKGTNKDLITTKEVMDCLIRELGEKYVQSISLDKSIPDDNEVTIIFDCYLDPAGYDPSGLGVYASILDSIEEARNAENPTPEQKIISLLSAENINPVTGCGIRNYFATGEMEQSSGLSNYSLIYPDGVARSYNGESAWFELSGGNQDMHLETYWKEFIGAEIIRPNPSLEKLNSSKNIEDIGFWDFKDYIDGYMNNIKKGADITWPRAHILVDEYLVDGNMVFPKISFEESYKNSIANPIDYSHGTEAQILIGKNKTTKYLSRDAFSVGLSLNIESLVKEAPTGWRPDGEWLAEEYIKFHNLYTPGRSIFTLGYIYQSVHLKINSLCQIEISLNADSEHELILVSDKVLDITQQLDIYFSVDLSQKKISLSVSGDDNYPNETELFALPDDFAWIYTYDWDSTLNKIDPEASHIAGLCEEYEGDACSDLDSVSNRLYVTGPLSDLDGFAGSIDWLYLANGVVDINTIKNKPGQIRIENPLPTYIPANISISPEGYAASAELNTLSYDNWTTKTLAPEGEYLRLLLDVYDKFEDEFDFIFLVNNDLVANISWPYYGSYLGWSNSNFGISEDKEKFDITRLTGSKGKLKGTIHFPDKNTSIQNGPSLHEVFHHWGNFSLATGELEAQSLYLEHNDFFLPEISSGVHWGLTSINGQLGGFNKDTLQELGNGDYKADAFGLAANGGNSIKYSNFELYLMGLIPPEEAEDIIMFKGVSSDTDRWANFEWSADEKIIISIDDVVNKIGRRDPNYENSQKEFKVLTLILTDKPLTSDEWSTFDKEAKEFETLFKWATEGRAQAESGKLSEVLKNTP